MHQTIRNMPMKKLNVIILIVFCANLVKAQNQFTKRSSTIRAFVSATFEDKKGTDYIIKNYMYVIPNNTISSTQRESVISNMIDTLVKKNRKILASSYYELFTYGNFKGIKKGFNTDDSKDIMIMTVKNTPIIYFIFDQDRIKSFTTIEKGSISFFVIV
jgi:hypothetical protein